MAADINTQLQNISTDVTAISNLVNRLVTIFSAGGVQNPDLATLKSEVLAFASNANNISSGVLATTNGGTGRTDGMVTDVFDTTYNLSLSQMGKIGYLKSTTNLTNDLENFVAPGLYYGALGSSSRLSGNIFENVFGNGVATTQFIYGHMNSWPNIFVRNVHSTSTDAGNKSWSWLFRPKTSSYSIYVKKDGNDNNLGTTSEDAIQSFDVLYTKLQNIQVDTVFIYIGPGEWDTLYIYGQEFNIHEITVDAIDANNPPVITTVRFRNCFFNLKNVYAKYISVWKSFAYLIDNVTTYSMTIDWNSSVRLKNITINGAESVSKTFIAVSQSYIELIDQGTISIKGNFSQEDGRVFCSLSSAIVNISPTVSFNLTETNGIFYKFFTYGVTNLLNAELTILPGSLDGSYGSGQVFRGVQGRTLLPLTDNASPLGNASLRWSQIFAGTGTINTSDEREKENIVDIPESVLIAWGDVKFNQFQFKDAVAEKGVKARLHSALVAQRVIKAFSDKGLDATKYGLLCYDEWEEIHKDKKIIDQPAVYEDQVIVDKEAVYDEKGNLITPEISHTERVEVIPEVSHIESEHQEAGSRYGIRYEEALCMEAAYQRYRADKLEKRIAALETKIK